MKLFVAIPLVYGLLCPNVTHAVLLTAKFPHELFVQKDNEGIVAKASRITSRWFLTDDMFMDASRIYLTNDYESSLPIPAIFLWKIHDVNVLAANPSVLEPLQIVVVPLTKIVSDRISLTSKNGVGFFYNGNIEPERVKIDLDVPSHLIHLREYPECVPNLLPGSSILHGLVHDAGALIGISGRDGCFRKVNAVTLISFVKSLYEQIKLKACDMNIECIIA